MKHLTRLLACGALLTAFALPALPQDNNSGAAAATTAAATQDDDACNALYTTFYNFQVAKDYVKANETGEQYLQKCPMDNDYRKAVSKYVKTYKMQQGRKAMYDALKANKYDDAFVAGKQVAVDYATDPQVFYDLTRAGGAAADLKNEKNNADAAVYAKQVVTFTEAGKLPKGVTKDQAFGEAYYTLGTVLEKPEDQIPVLIKAAQTQLYGKDAGVYFKLALAYQESEYAKNEQAYKDVTARIKDADNPEVKEALKNYQRSADRLIDALARTIVFATTPDTAPYKTSAMPLITSLYKFRNKSDAGLQAFISSILSKPIPQPGQPIDYFPPAVAATTPPANGTTTPANGTVTTPANGTATTPANGAKPGVKPPTKPKGKAKPKGKKG